MHIKTNTMQRLLINERLQNLNLNLNYKDKIKFAKAILQLHSKHNNITIKQLKTLLEGIL